VPTSGHPADHLSCGSPRSSAPCGHAPRTSCPNSLNTRLTQGECIPVSRAIRLRGTAPNTSRMAFGVVLSRCSNSTLPASSSTQYQLDRSPRSSPIVSFCSRKFFVCSAAVVLTSSLPVSFISSASSASITWDRTASRRRPAFSSHLVATVTPPCLGVKC
jgi:hypothetical protein